MRPGLYARLVRRESRGARGRLAFFAACLSVGVAAVVAVAGLSASLDRSIRGEAKQLLAADLAISGTRPPPSDVDSVVASTAGARRAELKELATVVSVATSDGSPGRSLLVELKVVEGDYPFYGTLALEPRRPLRDLLDADAAVVAPELLSRLGLAVGDRLRIGEAPFRIAGVVSSEPDRVSVSLTLGPRVFLGTDGFDRAGLERFGSRIEYRTLVKLREGASAEEVEGLGDTLVAVLPPGGWFKVETYVDAQPALREGIRRAERFLGLVALVSLLVGGIGVAQTVRAWIAGRLDAIAIQRCLGLRPREVLALYLGQTMLLAGAGSTAGAIAGIGALLVVPRLFSDVIPAGAVSAWQPLALARGVLLGIGVAALFSAPPLVTLRRVPPLRVLRHDAEPLRSGRWASLVASLALVGGVFGAAWIQSRSFRLGLGFATGVLAAAAALALAAWCVTRAVGVVPRRKVPHGLRHGLAALARPGAGTLGALVALGLGVLVVLATWLVQTRLSTALRADLPSTAPTAFLIDIQPDQIDGVRDILASEGAERIESVPMITARLATVDGRSTRALAAGAPNEGRARWVLTREQRLTTLRELPPDNEVVEGALWSDPSRSEVSIERDFARDLGVGLGSTLTFDVQGVPVDVVVTSLRTVDWRTFGINFFMVIEPGTLDGAPQTRVAVARIPADRDQAVQDRLGAAYPNVTMLRIREILDKVVRALERLGLAVRLLGGFTVAAGVIILAGAIGAVSVRRGREVALLKTLGMTRPGVVAVFSVEYVLIGLVAGAIGAVGAGVLAWVVLTRGMEIGWTFRPLPYVTAIVGAAVLSAAAGIGASARALARRPIEALRVAD